MRRTESVKQGRTALSSKKRPARANAALGGERAPVGESAATRSSLTVTREPILVDGSDLLFRELIQNLLIMSHQIQELRSVLAKQLGVTEPQYRVFLAVAQQGAHGISVGNVANRLRVTGAFVTREAGKLVSRGYLMKKEDPGDRRGVRLSLTERGLALFTDFAPISQAINDDLFGDLTAAEFRSLCDIARKLVTRGERTILLSRAAATSAPHAGGFEAATGARMPTEAPIDGVSARTGRTNGKGSR